MDTKQPSDQQQLVAVIRNGLVLAGTTPAGTLRVPSANDLGDHLVVIESRLAPNGWLVITRSTGCPPGCSFVPPVRLQSEDAANSDELAEALLCVGRAA